MYCVQNDTTHVVWGCVQEAVVAIELKIIGDEVLSWNYQKEEWNEIGDILREYGDCFLVEPL